MRFTRIELQNWKNFREVQVELSDRMFIIGPNGIGKSNFLDAFRFLRDVAMGGDGGGLAHAVVVRGGMKQIRSLHARQAAGVCVAANVEDKDGGTWRYILEFNLGKGATGSPQVSRESVQYKAGKARRFRSVLQRPDRKDRLDPARLRETALQQINANQKFRPLVDFFRSVLYLHIVPQLVRHGQEAPRNAASGGDLLQRIRSAEPKARHARLALIRGFLQEAVPLFDKLELAEDDLGRPHLVVSFKHWRGIDAFQQETELSDGTLRLIGLLWALQEKGGPLLLEEPELSVHAGILHQLAPLIASTKRQVLVSTHSERILQDEGIGADEILLIRPASGGSEVVIGADMREIESLMGSGVPASQAAYPYSTAPGIANLSRMAV